mgnify:CR=1 FL=1
MGAAGNHYTCHGVADMPSPMQFDPDVVYCWATCPRLDVAVDALRYWGLTYRGCVRGLPTEVGRHPGTEVPRIEFLDEGEGT